MSGSANGIWDRYAAPRNLSRNRLLLDHHAELIEDFLRVFGPLPIDLRILDIGPANGFFLTLLRELGFTKVEGFDASNVFADALREKNLPVVVGDIVTGAGMEKLTPPYDAIVMMEVLEHLPDPARALANVRRLVADDGLLYLTVPMCDCVFDRLRRILRGTTRKEQVQAIDETHIHTFSRDSLRRLLKSAGLEVTRSRRVSFRLPRRFRFQGRRAQLLTRAFLPEGLRGLCLSVVARPSAAGGGA